MVSAKEKGRADDTARPFIQQGDQLFWITMLGNLEE
jgi:hypothetical protein